jgi:hypothetical protein
MPEEQRNRSEEIFEVVKQNFQKIVLYSKLAIQKAKRTLSK